MLCTVWPSLNVIIARLALDTKQAVTRRVVKMPVFRYSQYVGVTGFGYSKPTQYIQCASHSSAVCIDMECLVNIGNADMN